MAGGEPFAYARDIHRFVINQNPEWDFRTLDFDRDLATIDARVDSVGMQAIDPNLEPFFSRGGKLLMYHGWNDPLVSPFNSVNYYNDVTATTPTLAADSIRLLMMPGVNHCRGGVGTDTWDQVAVLDPGAPGARRPNAWMLRTWPTVPPTEQWIRRDRSAPTHRWPFTAAKATPTPPPASSAACANLARQPTRETHHPGTTASAVASPSDPNRFSSPIRSVSLSLL